MKYTKSFIEVLTSNKFSTTTVKKVIQKKIQKKIRSASKKNRSIRLFFENDTASVDFKDDNIRGLIPVFYWDSKPNFGDFIGPYLISKITGVPILNIQNLQYSGIMAVGSILQMLDRKNMTVWGSGLIEEPTDEVIRSLQKYKPKILSVRGRETAKYLSKVGIDVPDQDVYGDPALILPLFYKPLVINETKIGICPHHIHKAYFLESVVCGENLKIIDVQKDVENVINEITSSSVCISTSLHGLIIAQAYNIPWVWLEVTDNNLIGNDFKFKDFFSTINQDQICHIRVEMEEVKNLNFETIANKAALPNKLYNEKLILESIKNYLKESRRYE
ncbi:polysaccharide pyruvyl transferase family protein [Psychrobacter celer]|uniref:polysaccharide pyruvyl transferase family protein n=1 Tax=Psychrobacter celer TaxID=306572 RepID=UPI003FD32FDE